MRMANRERMKVGRGDAKRDPGFHFKRVLKRGTNRSRVAASRSSDETRRGHESGVDRWTTVRRYMRRVARHGRPPHNLLSHLGLLIFGKVFTFR